MNYILQFKTMPFHCHEIQSFCNAVVVVNNPRWRRQNRSSSLEKAWSWMVSRPTIWSWVAASSAMIIYGEQGNHLVEWRWEPSLHPESSAHVHCALWRTTESSAHVHCAQWSVENKGGQCTVDEQACPVNSGEQQCGQGNEALNKSHFVICVDSLYFIYCCNHPKYKDIV